MKRSKEAELFGVSDEEFQQRCEQRLRERESQTHYVICFIRTGCTKQEGYISDSMCAVIDLLNCNDIQHIDARPFANYTDAEDHLLRLINESDVEWADDIDGDVEEKCDLKDISYDSLVFCSNSIH